jgi:hypothetical protein
MSRCGASRRPKKRFPTKEAAQLALVDVVMRRNAGKATHGEIRIYECGSCKGFHLTSHPRK